MSDKIHTDAEDILQELQNKNKQKVNNSCGCSHEEPESVAQTQSEGSCGCSHEEPSHGHEHSSASLIKPESISQTQSGGSCGCSHEEPESVAQTQSEGSCGCSHEEPSHGHEHSSASLIKPESISQTQSGGSCGCSHEEPESVAQTQSEGSCGCSHEEPSHGHEHSSASLIKPESISQTQSGGSCGCSHEGSHDENALLSLSKPEQMLENDSNGTGQTITSENSETKSEKTALSSEHDVIFIGDKPLMTYVTHTLTQLAIRSTVTLKARGRKITHAADVSQMIEKRMGSVGYKVMDVRISSDLLTHEGKERKVPTIEIDLSKN